MEKNTCVSVAMVVGGMS